MDNRRYFQVRKNIAIATERPEKISVTTKCSFFGLLLNSMGLDLDLVI